MQIAKPGKYKTRNGRIVEISDVDIGSPFTYPVKGHVLVPNKTGSRVKRNWSIWRLDGRHVGDMVEHQWDIVDVL